MDGRQSAGVHGRVQGRGGSTGDGRGAPSASSSQGPGHSAQAATATGCGGRRVRRRPMSKRHQVRDIHAVDVYGSRGRTVQLGKLVLDTAHDPSQDLVQQVRGGSHYSAPISSDRRFFPTSFKVRTFVFPIDPYIGQSRKIFNQDAPRGCDANFTRRLCHPALDQLPEGIAAPLRAGAKRQSGRTWPFSCPLVNRPEFDRTCIVRAG